MVPYLTGESIALRALTVADAESTGWFPGPFPVNPPVVAGWLRRQHAFSPWDDPPRVWLAVVPTIPDAAGDVIGTVRLDQPRGRSVGMEIGVAPPLSPDEADRVTADVIRLVVPWLLGEMGAMVVTLGLGSDQPVASDAATACGMAEAARLREHLAGPGGRADLCWWQAVNLAWSVPAGDASAVSHGRPAGEGR